MKTWDDRSLGEGVTGSPVLRKLEVLKLEGGPSIVLGRDLLGFVRFDGVGVAWPDVPGEEF